VATGTGIYSYSFAIHLHNGDYNNRLNQLLMLFCQHM